MGKLSKFTGVFKELIRDLWNFKELIEKICEIKGKILRILGKLREIFVLKDIFLRYKSNYGEKIKGGNIFCELFKDKEFS